MDIFLLFYYDTREAVTEFSERGGPLIPWIALLIFAMWLLVFERLWFYYFSYRKMLQELEKEWNERHDYDSWYAHYIRADLISQGETQIYRNVDLIKTCFMLCPLLGLLGTVTGMIDVFQILAITGGGDPKPMAGGVSRATLPTLTGMVGALSGFAALVLVRSLADDGEAQLEAQLSH